MTNRNCQIRRRRRGEGEAKKIEAIGQATAEAYRKQNAALGQEAITAIEVVKKVAKGNILITPDILVTGEKGGLLDILMAQLVRKGAAVKAGCLLPFRQGVGRRGNSLDVICWPPLLSERGGELTSNVWLLCPNFDQQGGLLRMFANYYELKPSKPEAE